ncbi:unnamed protein product [Prorocentrum cordatum]|uniref:Beta-galactosidase n=1 Tax=Prorocentrum cordatum TaxID=2364126 RepID=A0ABN9Q628_9DINO|nr:unnamed protein product [Polarella glacialis]
MLRPRVRRRPRRGRGRRQGPPRRGAGLRGARAPPRRCSAARAARALGAALPDDGGSEGGLRGPAVVAGGILVLELGESIQDARLELYANGFRLTPTTACFGGMPAQSRTWSPFSLVEKCQVTASAPHGLGAGPTTAVHRASRTCAGC